MNNSQFSPYIRIAIVAGIITLILTIAVLIHYARISKNPGTLVIPAGNTYLGPNAPDQNQKPAETSAWTEVKGHIYPYSLSVPSSLKLVTFTNDPYDIYAIDCCGIDPGSNVLIGVDNLNNNPALSKYIKQSKRIYVNEWWKQFSGLKSVSSIETFTNSKGLKGYKARYVNAAGATPNLDIFFEIPKRPELVIHMAAGSLDAATFASIIDSVNWIP